MDTTPAQIQHATPIKAICQGDPWLLATFAPANTDRWEQVKSVGLAWRLDKRTTPAKRALVKLALRGVQTERDRTVTSWARSIKGERSHLGHRAQAEAERLTMQARALRDDLLKDDDESPPSWDDVVARWVKMCQERDGLDAALYILAVAQGTPWNPNLAELDALGKLLAQSLHGTRAYRAARRDEWLTRTRANGCPLAWWRA